MLAIRNFGHFWSRDLVDWGTPGWGGAGSVLGYRLVDLKPSVVDFRDQIAVYVLFTAEREVVYIGQTGAGNQRLFSRLRHHSRRELRDRWSNFSWFGLRAVNRNGTLSSQQQPDSRVKGSNQRALDEVESVLLQLFEPRLNKQGPRWGAKTTEFYQYVPWEWESDQERPLDYPEAALAERIERIEQLVREIGEYDE
jgi:hypothetical protein